MLLYNTLRQKPGEFEPFSGLAVADFDALFREFVEAQEKLRPLAALRTKRATTEQKRQVEEHVAKLCRFMPLDVRRYLGELDPERAHLDARYWEIVGRYGEPPSWIEWSLRHRFGVFIDQAEPVKPLRLRKRKPGAGPKSKLDDRDRLLVTLVWIRIHPTYELLAQLCGLSKSNTLAHVRDVLGVLRTLPTPPVPIPQKRRRSSLSSGVQVRKAFPDLPKWVEDYPRRW
ncbi:DDE transposase family protein [Planctomyces sp. SH-PL62]|uniref:DDE transposase family protein n=1 Tax=Planctomyces sp. SH-PL62 TaxID=1636152 RepID=UPI00078D466E|nr:DDE transposase family protein [Planctomyces sp. SH-PL62]AMV40481.1 hypothetical protein VT85_23830 [Planctomyces sp. SH-PL62]